MSVFPDCLRGRRYTGEILQGFPQYNLFQCRYYGLSVGREIYESTRPWLSSVFMRIIQAQASYESSVGGLDLEDD